MEERASESGEEEESSERESRGSGEPGGPSPQQGGGGGGGVRLTRWVVGLGGLGEERRESARHFDGNSYSIV